MSHNLTRHTRESGYPVRGRLSVNHCCLWNTGSSAFADDDSGVFGGSAAYLLTLKNSLSSVAASVSPTAE
ncbi:hypothetical protein SAMN05443247_09050 [Bradyrhizobium erythrophlei]|nr:hypothetical protein SAMN05443247_09050 [Bradyrhizobium erythrophlei]